MLPLRNSRGLLPAIAVLLEHEADGAPHFEAAGWRVFHADAVLSAPEPLFELLPDEVAE